MEHTCELIRQAKEGNMEARSRLVEENVGLIWSVVRRFQGRGCDSEDLFQIGSIGLLKCIDHFDLSREVKFSTYAVPLIMGESFCSEAVHLWRKCGKCPVFSEK